MARPIRIEFPGAVYHIIQRGFRRERVFESAETKRDYLDCLHTCCLRFHVELLAWCLMDNHIHLLLSTKQANLTRFMQVFNSTFANRRQRFRSLDGTIFAGRYKSLLVDTDAWLLQVSLYIHLNPVRARMTTDPASYEWSSCQDYLSGKQKKRYGVLVDPVLHMIANTSKDQIRQYRTLLQENLTCELPPTHRGVCYAECDLAETMDQLIEDQSNTKHESDILCWKLDSTELIDLILEITNNKRADLFERKRNNIPKLLVCHALHKLTPLTLKEIGKILEMTFHAVSDSSKRFENKRKTTKQYQEYWQKLQQQISNINSKLEL